MLTSTTTTEAKASPEQPLTELDQFMIQKHKIRNETYKMRILKTFEPVQNLQERVIVGLLSWTLLDRGERWIKPPAVLSTQYGLCTASEIARDYLDFKFPKRLRALGQQVERLKLHRSAPLFIRPGVYRDYCYLDLSSAFFSIMVLTGWNVDYNPYRWLLPGQPPVDFPLKANKIARNCLVTAGRPNPMKLWTGKSYQKKWGNNVHINLGLWAVIMDTLHCIASEALECEAVYIHTDGYIIPTYRAYDLQERIAAYGLDAAIKLNSIGDCIMLGSGNWRCGERKTKAFNRSSGTGFINHVYKMDNRLIKRKLARFKKLRQDTGTLDKR